MSENEKQKTAGHKRAGWARAVDIGLRSIHIGVAGVLLGGVVFGQPLDTLHYWARWTVWTGLGLVASEIYHSWRWPYQGAGVMATLHIGCVALLHIWPHHAEPLLWAALLIGAIGSHMPRKLRHWSILHGRVVD